MNNFINVLVHLKQFEGDGKYHIIEDLLKVDFESRRIIFQQLIQEGLIKLTGGYRNIDNLVTIGDGRGNSYTLNVPDKVIYYPYKAQITFKGSEYLRKETSSKPKSSIKLKAGKKARINLIVDSKNSRIINNSDKIVSAAKKIIKTLNADKTLNTAERVKALNVFETLITEAQEKAIKQSTWEKVTSIGSDVASIVSMVLSLIPLK